MPRYSQIKRHLLDAIESGQLRPGDRVPSERELTEQFAVSRMTARHALRDLETMGYLYRLQGKGTFVAHPKLEQQLARLTSFTEDMRLRGMEPGARVLSVAEMPAGARVARALGVSEAEPVYRLERLRLADGQPMALEVSHVLASACPGFLDVNFENESLYRILRERFGIVLVRATQSLEAVPASPYEAEILRVREEAPLLLLERVSYDAAGRAVEFVRSFYRSDRYRFTTELVHREDLR